MFVNRTTSAATLDEAVGPLPDWAVDGIAGQQTMMQTNIARVKPCVRWGMRRKAAIDAPAQLHAWRRASHRQTNGSSNLDHGGVTTLNAGSGNWGGHGTHPASRRSAIVHVRDFRSQLRVAMFRVTACGDQRGTGQGMRGMRLIKTAVAASLVFGAISVAADWKRDVARRAVGRVVQEALEEAIEDAALDRALDTATAPAAYAAPTLRHVDEVVDVGQAVSEGVETALRVADVAETLDAAADVARTVKKLKKLKR